MQKWFLRLYSTRNFERRLKKLVDADPVPWSKLCGLNNFFKSGSDKLAIRKYLPLLAARAEQVNHPSKTRFEAVNSVGDFAVRCGQFSALPTRFKMHWISILAETDRLQAIRVWKLAYSVSTDPALLLQGIKLYIQTNQIEKAEKYATQCDYWPAYLVRLFYSYYMQTRNARMAHIWLRRWPALTSADLQWASAAAAESGVLNGVKFLETPMKAQTNSMSGRKIDRRTLSYIKNVNALICVYNLLDIDAILVKWRQTMSDPTFSCLDELVIHICRGNNLLIDEGNIAVWTRLMRVCSIKTLETILQTQRLLPAAYAVYLGRICISELPEVVQSVPVEILYTQPCLTTLARRSPELFADIALAPGLIDSDSFEYKEVHTLSLWTQADALDGLLPWLFPLSLQFLYSEHLLRIVVRQLLRRKEMAKVFLALYYYLVVYNQPVSPQSIKFMSNAAAAPKTAKQKVCDTPSHQVDENVLLREATTDPRLIIIASALDTFQEALETTS